MPDNLLEFKRPRDETAPESEEQKRQREAAEVLITKQQETEAGVVRQWSTIDEMGRLARETEAAIGKPTIGEEVHHEAGIPLKAKYPSAEEVRAAVASLIAGSKLEPFELQEKFNQDYDQYKEMEKAEDDMELPKVA